MISAEYVLVGLRFFDISSVVICFCTNSDWTKLSVFPTCPCKRILDYEFMISYSLLILRWFFSVLLTCEANLHLSFGIQTNLKQIAKSNIADIMNFQMNLNRMDKWFDEMQYLTFIVGPFNIENLKCKRQVFIFWLRPFQP